MRVGRGWTRRMVILVALWAVIGGVGRPQIRPAGQSVPGGQSAQNPLGTNPLPELGPSLSPAQEEKQAKARNEDRQKRLEADTNKLLELATELHTDVAKTNKNVLSIDVIKRADEIEKLAHAVKERMRG